MACKCKNEDGTLCDTCNGSCIGDKFANLVGGISRRDPMSQLGDAITFQTSSLIKSLIVKLTDEIEENKVRVF